MPYRVPSWGSESSRTPPRRRTYMDITGTGHQVGATPMYLDSIGVRKDGDWSHWLPSRVLPFG